MEYQFFMQDEKMILDEGKPMREFRCTKCRALLGLEYIYAGRLAIKCHNCNELNRIDFKTTKDEIRKLYKVELKGGE